MLTDSEADLYREVRCKPAPDVEDLEFIRELIAPSKPFEKRELDPGVAPIEGGVAVAFRERCHCSRYAAAIPAHPDFSPCVSLTAGDQGDPVRPAAVVVMGDTVAGAAASAAA